MYPYNFKSPGIDHKKIFVIMPFAVKYDFIFNDLINTSVEHANEILKFSEDHEKLFAFRTKEDRATTCGWINVLQHLMTAQINMGVLTDQNPNVFYEMGIAHATQPIQRQILIADKDYNPTFDTKDLIFFKYNKENLKASSIELAKWIVEAIKMYNIDLEKVIKKARMSLGPYDFEVVIKQYSVSHFTIESENEEQNSSFEKDVLGIKNLCNAGLLGLNTISRDNNGRKQVEYSYYWTSLGNDVLYMMKLITQDELLLRRKNLPDFF
ncbi:MAG: hypothetical protein IPM56_02840 [Ignavibacteriales bacterium]|nr:MAG: hypothetical protein IPM56_02840 [Ignavibacteriales bacterium]